MCNAPAFELVKIEANSSLKFEYDRFWPNLKVWDLDVFELMEELMDKFEAKAIWVDGSSNETNQILDT